MCIRDRSSVPRKNAFKVFKPTGNLEIVGLLTAKPGMPIAIMGAYSGWQEGKVGMPIITDIDVTKGYYPSWTATYSSQGGDSGSPVLTKDSNGKWHLVGIHFASGPRFHSWNNVEISVSEN